MSTFALPDLGEGLQEAEIVTWHVGVGDHVVADQPLVSVETEKAVVEVPAPQSGHIARLLADEELRRRIGRVARQWAVRSLSWESRVAEYEKLYASLVR